MKRWIYFLVLVAVTSALSIHLLPKIPDWLFGVHHQYSDPSKPIHIASGRQFVIALESTRTTGYEWRFASPVDKDYLEVIEIRHGAKQTKLAGAGSKEFWTFNTMRPGKTVVAFEYVRAWEKGAPPVKTAIFEIDIEKDAKAP